ncbi:ankyrin repeat domain-containing protein [Wolbachia endosymbiont (group B) of Agriphila straminella]|uniref:ankyrin repeat domain-containing protein n=1 Tax=Wolbachia endosymbiont (group B) of Agriphila straminella TaxID=2953972 RepID=UPI002225E354|nr:ankyrin repeat domain-containing protein [Wolbachia endosymbiont (group B) of Agriphila straminella]
MRVNFSQYVEGEKLSVSSFMLSLINLGQNEKISTKKINDKKHIEEKEREEVVQEIMSKKQQELVNQLIEFLQSNKHIKELSLQDSWYCTRTIETLAQSSSLQNLRKLNLNLEDIDVEAIKTLAKSPHLQNLEKLIIHSRSIDCKIVEAIAELRDHRIEFDKLFSNEYQIFYRFLLSKVYFDNQIAGEKDVEKMVMDSALFDPREKVIEYILENPDRYPLSINSQDRIPGKPLLHFAARMGMLELVKILMRNGGDVNTINDGETPLHLAAKYVYTKPMLDLIKIGLSINSINAYNLAGKRNATEVVQALIKAGADINAVNRTGETPLTTADNAKNTDLSRLIVNHITKLEAIELYISDQNLQKKMNL